MNILSQIIPGVREARTPFTVGILWSLVAWVGSSFLPTRVWRDPAIRQGNTQFGHLPIELRIGIATLLIYLAGMLMQEIGSRVTGLLVPILMVGYGLLVAYLLFVPILRFTLIALGIGAALFLGACVSRHRRHRVPFWESVEAIATSVAIPISRWIDKTVETFRQTGESHRLLFNELSHEDLESHYGSHPSFLSEKIREMDQPLLYEAAIRVDLTLEEINAAAQSGNAGVPADVRSVTDLRLYRRQHGGDDGDVREALIVKLDRSREARDAFANVLDLTEHRNSLRRRLEQANHILRSTRPELYAEFDRVRAEGEFRTGVAFPLASLIAIVAYRWNLEFNHSDTVLLWTSVGIPAGVWIVIGLAGSAQTSAAKRMLYAAIRNKTIILEREDRVGEPIFIYKRPPEIRRPAVVKYAIRSRLRRWAYKPAQWIFPELRTTAEDGSEAAPTNE